MACVHELIRWATEQNPNKKGIRKTRFLICRNTSDQLKSTTLKTIFDWIPPSWAGAWVVSDKTFYIRFGLPDGTVVETDWLAIALDTPDDVRKALSLEATGLWGNESRELHPDVVDGLLMRVNRYPSMKDGGPTRPGAIFDTNMPQHGSWWADKMMGPPANWDVFVQPPAILTAKEWLEKYGTGTKRWEMTNDYVVDATANESGQIAAHAERPGAERVSLVGVNSNQDTYVVDHEADNFTNLNPSYYPNTLEGKTDEFINVYLRCQFGQSKEGKPVFESFRRDVHVSKTPLTAIQDPNRPLIIGIDFGLTPACTINQVDVRGRLLTLAELAVTNMGIYRFATERLQPLLASRFPGLPVLIVGDPSGVQRSQTDESTVFGVLESLGFKAVPATTNNIERRILAVEMLLSRMIDGLPGHLIDPSCTTLIGALSGGYRFRVRRTGEVEDKPEKNGFSHLADGHQYACLHVQGGTDSRGMLHQRTPQRRNIKTVSMSAWL